MTDEDEDRAARIRAAELRARQAKSRLRRRVTAIAFGVAAGAVIGLGLAGYVGLVMRVGKAVAG